MSKFSNRLPKFLKSKWVLGLIVLLVVLVGWRVLAHRGGASYQFVPVTQGPVTQTVSVTGNTTPMQSVAIGFQNSGTIGSVRYQLGDAVAAGSVIASLNTASLSASLAQAQASLSAQQANLAGLQAGSQPQDIAASQAALAGAQQTLTNLYGSISDASSDAYAKANDAVRTQLGPLFSDAETTQPKLTFQTSDSQGATDALAARVSVSTALNQWQSELAGFSSASTTAALSALIARNTTQLSQVQSLLQSVSATLNSANNLSTTQLSADKAAVTQGLSEVDAAASSLNTIQQNIASQQTSVAQAQAQLALKQAGSTPQAIAAGQAQVAQAQAGVASAEANLQGSEIVAPISGTLTQQDAKVGQQASPGTPLVSIIGTSGFEVDAGASETDVGKLAVGDTATMTLDAFPGQTFTGSVFYIAPAQTDTQGVITYLTKISFDKTSAPLKSGLTANIDIQTKHDANAFILPEYAILQNDSGTFVESLAGGTVTTTPVTLGIQDENGNVEVLSGVTVGEQVINIGLKATQ